MSSRRDPAAPDSAEVDSAEKSSVRRRVGSHSASKTPAEVARIVRFARLLRAAMPDEHPDARLLQLAITRRDVTLLEALLHELHLNAAADPAKAG